MNESSVGVFGARVGDINISCAHHRDNVVSNSRLSSSVNGSFPVNDGLPDSNLNSISTNGVASLSTCGSAGTIRRYTRDQLLAARGTETLVQRSSLG